MKATISKLWNTDRDIILINGSATTFFDDLEWCDNVIIRDINGKTCEAFIDNNLYVIEQIKVEHPFAGMCFFLEVKV